MSASVCEWFDVPLMCHEAEREVAETGETASPMPDSMTNRLLESAMAGDGHPVAETLRGGDTVAGFEVVETPGNAEGHISLWREADGTLILGDVLSNIDLFTGQYGLTELPRRFTVDPVQSVESARAVADLEPDLVCFGHGPPLDDGEVFQEFVASLG